MIFRFVSFFLFFLFSFFFCKTRTWLPRTLRDKKGLFGTLPHLTYHTLPFTYLRYVNLSNIRYLFTYQTSSQTPNLLYLYPSTFRALLSPLTTWFGQSHRSNQSRRVSIVPVDHIFQSSLIISRTVKNFPIVSLILGTYGHSFPTLKAKIFEFEFPYPYPKVTKSNQK